jgi:8-oxo-dGTP diphosphatase
LKRLVKVAKDIPWHPQPGEGRLYITDELPDPTICSTAFGFVFENDKILLTRLRDRDWDIPGGCIDAGEASQDAAVREVWEETSARVEIVELVGIQELEVFGPKPDGYRWPYPISVQVMYLCRLVELRPFEENHESSERGFFDPDAARMIPTMVNHDAIYEEALRRAMQSRAD